MDSGTTKSTTVERCAGHDGTWGVKTEHSTPTSMKIGRPVFRQMGEDEPDYVSSDCPIAGRAHPAGDREQAQTPSRTRGTHPLTLLRIAYGLRALIRRDTDATR